MKKNNFWTISFLVVVGLTATFTGVVEGRLNIAGIGLIVIGGLIANHYFQKKLKKNAKE